MFARTIPRRIVQTGKTHQQTPLERAAVASLRALNPSFEYHYFTDDDVVNFISDNFPEYQDQFHSFPYRIQKYDFFRYLAIYKLGGFYFDQDVLLAQSLEPLLNHSCVFPFEELTISRFLRERYDVDWEIGNYAFGAAPGHPFLAAVIDNCLRSQNDKAWAKKMMDGVPSLFRRDLEVLNTSGPGLLTRTLAERPEAQGVTVLFPPDVCDESSWHLFGDYGVHLMAGSWRIRGNLLKRRLARMWEAAVRAKVKKSSLERGKTRSLPALTAV